MGCKMWIKLFNKLNKARMVNHILFFIQTWTKNKESLVKLDSQKTFACSTLTIETLENGVKYV